jgi:hypothetical protein
MDMPDEIFGIQRPTLESLFTTMWKKGAFGVDL